jgi:hypothetical protein
MKRYTEQELKSKTDAEIQEIAKELGGISVKSNSKTDTLIKRILEKQNPHATGSLYFDNIIAFENKTQTRNEEQNERDVKVFINKFTIQINKSNLLDYFGSALIYPVNYETRELARSQRTKDIQHFSPNHLLISDGFTDEPNEQQVLIEVSLSKFDKHNLVKLHEKAYLLSYPLPISRVTKLYFASKESQVNSIASANTFQDAFLPIHLFDTWSEKIENRISIVQEIPASQIPANKQLKADRQDSFNRVLGMLAFMKNAELYFANDTKELSKYSDKYLKLLKEINPFFEKPEIGTLDKGNLSFYLTLLKPKPYGSNETLQKIVNAIYDNETFRKDIFKQILGTPTEETQYAFKQLVNDKTLEALQTIDQLKPAAPELILLAFLFRFRDKDGSDKYALKEQLPFLINKKLIKTTRTLSRASIVLAILGLYYGYRSLPKDEEIKLNDIFFASFGDKGKFNIKYKLDNLLDRITIESIFQYCFWDNQKNEFDYLKDDQTFIKFDLIEGYSDDKTFSIVENYPIIKITKQHSEINKKIKCQIVNLWNKFKTLIDALKKNGLVQGEITFDITEFDVWLHNNPSDELIKILAKIDTSTENESTNN